MLKYIEDPDIKPVVQYAYDLSSTHIEKLESIFKEEQYAVPNGFTDKDVNMNAPWLWLFTDVFCLTYVNYSTAAAASQRSDLMINYERLSLEVTRLAKSGSDVMIKHGWLEQPPGVKDPEKLARDKLKG